MPAHYTNASMRSAATFLLILHGAIGSATDTLPVVPVKATVGEASSGPWSVCGPHGCAPVDQICGAWGCAQTKDICSSNGCNISHQASSSASVPLAQVDLNGGDQQVIPDSRALQAPELNIEACTTPGGCFRAISDFGANFITPINAQLTSTCLNPPGAKCNCPRCKLLVAQDEGSQNFTAEVCGDVGCVSLDEYVASIVTAEPCAEPAYYAKSEL